MSDSTDGGHDWRSGYEAMFGFVPPFVDARLDVQTELDPRFRDAMEAFRAAAFANPALDDRTKQLIAFAVLLSHIRPAAANHLVGARRAGASWDEINAAAEIVTVLGALGPGNRIGELIAEARAKGA
jgi:alkylhydroperoxidase/carboxymuconolactone decarboxylase family protein YurZ